MVAVTVFLSSLFFNYLRAKSGTDDPGRAKKAPERTGIRALIIFSLGTMLLFFIFAEGFLQLVASHAFSEGGYDVAILLGIIIFSALVLAWSSKRTAAALEFVSGILFFGMMFFNTALAGLPYLIYPSSTIFTSFTDPQSAAILFGVFAVGALITVPALVLLYSLFVV